MAERQGGLQEPHGTYHNHDSQKCSHDGASMSLHTSLIGLKPYPTEGGYQYATGWERCGDEVVHQPIEDDAAPGKMVRSQGECAIGLLEECHEASVSSHGLHDQPAAGSQGPYSMSCGSPTCAKGVLVKIRVVRSRGPQLSTRAESFSHPGTWLNSGKPVLAAE